MFRNIGNIVEQLKYDLTFSSMSILIHNVTYLLFIFIFNSVSEHEWNYDSKGLYHFEI